MGNIINNQMIEDIRNLLINSRLLIQETVSLKLSWTHNLIFSIQDLVSNKYLPTVEELQKELLRERNLLLKGSDNE
ncbi:hypothetical protein [Arcobacter ellisii]|uniref:Uncharacterized protein n=1 Tax=Arcobacter ellisii TaxID=913109 RepID=A0A347U8B2_9BACT|nr:hypothetical protein [Arcobacter ellisii]AXX95090.1 hypothetical protein AELL_1427 [Arcobacter ellisii]RXI30408.1 hypothetical protein CP962_08670 [Arcobacter ellisii]